jgi:hypothetical protein
MQIFLEVQEGLIVCFTKGITREVPFTNKPEREFIIGLN